MRNRTIASIVAVIVAGALAAGTAHGAIINVNIITSGNPESGLVGPAGGLGETWNQVSGTSGSNLLDSTGATSTVGFTTTRLDGPWSWGTPNLRMLYTGRARFDTSVPGQPQGLTINGLTSGDSYDVWIASANTLSSQRSQGEWTMVNPTTTAPVQTVDNTANINGDTWELGNNYVVYRNVEVDASDQIALTGLARRDTSYDTRLPLNGFQLVPSVPDGALAGQLGILDLNANGGLNPATGNPWEAGDTYRFAFVSSGTRNATSTDINDYNAFVQNAAIASSLNLSAATWKVIASTEAVNARVNTSTLGTGGEAIFLLNGSTVVANNYGDLWNGLGPNFIDLDENATFLDTFVFAGTTPSGATVADRWLGTTTLSNGALRVERGDTTPNNAGRWIQQYNDSPTTNRSFYALSDPLAIIVSGDPVRYEVAGDNNIGTETWIGTQSGEVIAQGVDGARVVRIIQNKPNAPNPLMLNEVQAIETGTLTNVAPAGSATQSSQLGGFAPGLAIDNNLNNFTHTLDGQGQWWQVQLAADTDLDKLTIFSRNGCCNQGRTADIQVQVFGDAGLTDMLFDQQVVGIGTSDVRDVPLDTLVSADLVATLNPYDFGAGYTYVFELGSADKIEVGNPNPSIFDTYLDLNNAALEVELLDPNMTFSVGDVFDLFDADFILGRYHSLLLPDIGHGLAFYTGYLPIDGTLRVMVPEPATLSLLGLGALLALRRRRRTR